MLSGIRFLIDEIQDAQSTKVLNLYVQRLAGIGPPPR